MTLVFAEERFEDCQPSLARLLNQHWEEVALNHNEVSLDPDWPRYYALAAAGALHCITIRNSEGVLVGYHVAVKGGHMHYKSTIHLITDVYYVVPEYREGMVLLRLLRFVEKCARAMGVKKLFTATKLHLDMGAVFERAKYRETERLYAKILRD